MRKRQEALLYSQPHCPQAATEAVVKSAPLGTFTYTVKGKRYLRGSCVSFGRHLHAPIGDMPQLAKGDKVCYHRLIGTLLREKRAWWRR